MACCYLCNIVFKNDNYIKYQHYKTFKHLKKLLLYNDDDIINKTYKHLNKK